MDWKTYRTYGHRPSFRGYLKFLRGITSHKENRDEDIASCLKSAGLQGNFKDVCRLLSQGENHTKGRQLTKYGKVARHKGKLLPLSDVLTAQRTGRPLYTVPFVQPA